jgi:hypothetical protein
LKPDRFCEDDALESVGGHVEAQSLHRSERRRLRLGTVAVCAGLASATLAVLVLHLAPALGLSPIANWLPSYQLQLARRDFTAEGNTISPSVAAAIPAVAGGAPLEAIPFYFRAIELEAAGEDEKILPLLDEALKRDPRHYYARLWRARIYYRTQRIAEAVDEVLKVIPLHRREEADLIAALVDVARDPGNRAILLELIAKQPPWAGAFMRRVEAEIDDESFRLALASQSSASLNRHVRELIQNNDHERAFQIWQATLTEDQLLAFSWPVDSRFAPGNEDAPFGWRSDRNTASRGPDGLSVFYNGRGTKQMLSQTMLLGQGYRYRIALWISGDLQEDGGWFQWTMRCAAGEPVVGVVDVRSIDPKTMPVMFDVALPYEGCAAQSLSLAGKPGEYSYPARLSIREVRISELGRAPEPAAAMERSSAGAEISNTQSAGP